MANLKPALTPEEVKKAGVSNIRTAYNDLAVNYTRILDRDLLLCPSCGNFISAETGFYFDKNYATNRYPICKRCLIKIVEQRKTDKDEPNETKESVQKVLQMMDRIYDDNFYNECVKGALDNVKEKNRNSPFATYITAIQSLPNWKGKTWKDSDFGETAIDQTEINENSRILKNARKRFGTDYRPEELVWLENEYQDWITRYECNTKAQEEIYKNLSTNRLERKQAVKEGKPTKEIDKTFQELLATQNIQPRQTGMDTLAEAQTFGTLLQKYEDTRPLPEIDPELQDVDKIGLYFDVFFRGHTLKMLGLKNTFTNIYEKIMKKYTVTKPEYNEEEDSEAIFEKVFGSISDE